MQIIKERLHVLFPRELLWLVFWPFIIVFFFQTYNPVQIINNIILFLLAIYAGIFIYKTNKELKYFSVKILNFIFSWLLNSVDMLVNYLILQDSALSKNPNFIFFRILHSQNILLNLLVVLLFKIAMSTIAFLCLEKNIRVKKEPFLDKTFWELSKFPYEKTKNAPLYLYLYSLLSLKNKELFCEVEKAELQNYYFVFYRPLYLIIVFFSFVFCNNLIILLTKPTNSPNLYLSAYSVVVLFLTLGILPVVYFYWHKKGR